MTKYFPYVDFVRSNFCGRHRNSILHQDVGPVGGNVKQMKEYYITTGLIVAYKNTFDVGVYNIQAPTKSTIPEDYSHEYYSRIMV